jgi:hypothetical protein
VKGELFNSGLNCVEVATREQRVVATTIATTTSPTKDNADSFGISDRCNCCAKFSCKSSSQLQANTSCSAKTSKF